MKPKKSLHKERTSGAGEATRVVIGCSLPPLVEGQLRCFLALKVIELKWCISHPPLEAFVLIKWWGDSGTGLLLRPGFSSSPSIFASDVASEAHFPVRCGPKQFAAYVADMGSLMMEVVFGPSRMLLGHAEMININELSASTPLLRWCPIISNYSTAAGKELGKLYVSAAFKSISDAYNITSAAIPTPDTAFGRSPVSQTNAKLKAPSRRGKSAALSENQNSKRKFLRAVNGDSEANLLKTEALPSFDDISFVVGPGVDDAGYVKLHHKPVDDDQSEKESQVDFQLDSQKSGYPTLGIEAHDESIADSVREASYPKQGSSSIKNADVHDVGTQIPGTKPDLLAVPPLAVDGLTGHLSPVEDNTALAPGSLMKEILDLEGSAEVGISDHEDSSLSARNPVEHKAVDLIFGREPSIKRLLQLVDGASDNDLSLSSELSDPLHDSTLLSELFYANKSNHLEESSVLLTDEDEQSGKGNIVQGTNPSDADVAKYPAHESSRLTDESKLEMMAATSSDPLSSYPSREPDDVSRGLFSYVPQGMTLDKLTAISRVKSVKVCVDHLFVTSVEAIHVHEIAGQDGEVDDNAIGFVYFVEYDFPILQTDSKGTRASFETVRAVSRKCRDGAWEFFHHDVFPVVFNGAAIEYWWKNSVQIRVYRRSKKESRPEMVGLCELSLRKVIQDENLRFAYDLAVCRSEKQDKSSLLLKIHVNLTQESMSRRGKSKSATASEAVIPSSRTIGAQESENAVSDVVLERQAPSLPCGVSEPPVKLTVHVPPVTSVPINHTDAFQKAPKSTSSDPGARAELAFALESLLVVSAGRQLSCDDSSATCNSYLVCRIFWDKEPVKSRVCWNTNEPVYDIFQVAPLRLDQGMVMKMRNNFMVIEVWNKSPTATNDVLLGISKVSINQFHLSFRESSLAAAMMRAQFPVLAFDGWVPISCLSASSESGQLKVLLALGSHDQIVRLQTLHPAAGSLTVIPSSRQRADAGRVVSDHPGMVRHVVEIVIESVKNLTPSGSEALGETDCFVQYMFAGQSSPCSDTTVLRCFKTATCLCLPHPIFQEAVEHVFVLPRKVSLQQCLIRAFNKTVVDNGAIPFELWKRHYFPNVRDQLAAKAYMSLQKLSAMISMHSDGEESVQMFQLPLMASEMQESSKTEVVSDIGSLHVCVRYRRSDAAVQLSDSSAASASLVVNLRWACGLKAAAERLSTQKPTLSYVAEVGLDVYTLTCLSFQGEVATRKSNTVARTFAPTFSYCTEFLLPLVEEDASGRPLALAERLETGYLICQLKHEVADGVEDMVVGVVSIPLSEVLSKRSGIHGWFPVSSVSKKAILKAGKDVGSTSRARKDFEDEACGGMEIQVSFAQPTDREAVVNAGRGVGWCPVQDVGLADEAWWNTGHDSPVGGECVVTISIASVLLPSEFFYNYVSKQEVAKTSPCFVYARYQFFDEGPTCSKLSSIVPFRGGFKSKLRHQKDACYVPTTDLACYLREEKLQVQFWLAFDSSASQRATTSTRRDKLLGAAYVDMSLLSRSPTTANTVSGRFPLYKRACDFIGSAAAKLSVSISDAASCRPHTPDERAVPSFVQTVGAQTSAIPDVYEESESTRNDVRHADVGAQTSLSLKDASDTTTAHVYIDEASHLKLETKSYVSSGLYVSYTLDSEFDHVCTNVVPTSGRPQFRFQKLETVPAAKFRNQHIVFNLWSCVNDQRIASTGKDVLLGSAVVSTEPLFYGMKQILGWYDIHDLNRSCFGQIKVGIVPSSPLSPCKSAKYFSRKVLPGVEPEAFRNLPDLRDGTLPNADGIDLRRPLVTRDAQDRALENPPRGLDVSTSDLVEQLKRQLTEMEAVTRRLVLSRAGQPAATTGHANQETATSSFAAKARSDLGNICFEKSQVGAGEMTQRHLQGGVTDKQCDNAAAGDRGITRWTHAPLIETGERSEAAMECAVVSQLASSGSSVDVSVVGAVNALGDRPGVDELISDLNRFRAEIKRKLSNSLIPDTGVRDNDFPRYEDQSAISIVTSSVLSSPEIKDDQNLSPDSCDSIPYLQSDSATGDATCLPELAFRGGGDVINVPRVGDALVETVIKTSKNVAAPDSSPYHGALPSVTEVGSPLSESPAATDAAASAPVTLPNFFMPQAELAKSMRAMRLAASFRHEPRTGGVTQSKRGDACSPSLLHIPSTSSRRSAREGLVDGQPPIPPSEVARIASIFSSGN